MTYNVLDGTLNLNFNCTALHWLPVGRQVDYKTACLMHQSLSGLARHTFRRQRPSPSPISSRLDTYTLTPLVTAFAASGLEQSAVSLATRHQLRTIYN